jgi:plasmid stabilization system protein ParE
MAVVILPDAQEDLLSLQEYMLDKWSEADWLQAENDIFEKLALVDTGFLEGASVQELATVGIFEYQNVFTSHHKLVYRRINADTYVYAVASHKQNFQRLLMKRLLKI